MPDVVGLGVAVEEEEGWAVAGCETVDCDGGGGGGGDVKFGEMREFACGHFYGREVIIPVTEIGFRRI